MFSRSIERRVDETRKSRRFGANIYLKYNDRGRLTRPVPHMYGTKFQRRRDRTTCVRVRKYTVGADLLGSYIIIISL